MKRGKPLLGLALLLALVACSSSKPSASVTAPLVSSSTATSSSAPAGPTDEERANAIAIVQEDLTSDWTASPSDSDNSQDAFDKKFEECSGLKDATAGQTADVFGDDFSLQAAQVGSEIDFTKTAAQQRLEFDAFFKPKTLSCALKLLPDVLKAELKKDGLTGMTVDAFVLKRIAINRYVDSSARLLFSARIHYAGQTIPFYAHLVGLRKGRLSAALSFVNVGAAFPPALEERVIRAVVKRMNADGGA